MTLNLNIVT